MVTNTNKIIGLYRIMMTWLAAEFGAIFRDKNGIGSGI
jgi:hypothetical protein